MASVIPYTKRQFVQRVEQHMNNDFPTDDWSVTEEEMMLYIDTALAYAMVGQIYANAQVEGTLVMPEAYITTYSFTNLQQDDLTKEWYITLPQPPVSLPLGISITDAYFVDAKFGKSQPIFLLKAKRKPIRRFMPAPAGIFGWVENSIFWMDGYNGQSLLGKTLRIEMAKTRTDNLDETMALPDDIIQPVFDEVVKRLMDRLNKPHDIIKDNIPPGNNTLKS